jgi:transcriptional regulator with XRE-family HTH domain
MTTSVRGQKLATLREVCGLTQKELADLVGRSVHTVRGIEQGKNVLGERLAGKVARATGVSMAWLMVDSITKPPFTQLREALTREEFQSYRVSFLKEDMSTREVAAVAAKLVAAFEQLVKEASETTMFDLAVYRVAKFLSDFERDFTLREVERSVDHHDAARLEWYLRFFQELRKPVKSSGSKKKRP